MEKAMTIEKIMEVIPNRYPILYVDYVDEISGDYILATKNVTIHEDFFVGHFPKNPTMPGVLILETMAQVGSILILTKEEFKNKTAYIGGIDKARFRQKVVPGDVLKMSFEIVKMKNNVGTAKSFAKVEGKTVAQCEFTFIVGEEKQA